MEDYIGAPPKEPGRPLHDCKERDCPTCQHQGVFSARPSEVVRAPLVLRAPNFNPGGAGGQPSNPVGHQYFAPVDTYADVSCISPESVQALGLSVLPTKPGESKTLNMASTGISVPRLGTALAEVHCGDQRFVYAFEILDMPDSVLLGRDILPRLGIALTGVPLQFPGQYQAVAAAKQAIEAEQEFRTRQKPWSLSHAHDTATLGTISNGMSDLLVSNAEIDPSEPACPTLPEAVMRLPMKLDEDPSLLREATTYIPQYQVPQAARPAVHEQFAKWSAQHCFEEAEHRAGKDWNSPFIAPPKKDGHGGKSGVRVCMDTKHINALLDGAPFSSARVPRIEDILRRFRGFTHASALDLSSAYQQLPVDPKDRHKLAFTYQGRRYQWKRWPFGLSPATPQFQKVMERVLRGIDGVIIYVDDVVVMTNGSVEDHIKTLRQVVQRLNEHKLRLNLDKCHFGYKRIVVLGHQVSGEDRNIDPDKVKQVIDWPVPRTSKDIMRFLGFTNFVRDYIPGYAQLSAPLDSLRHAKGVFQLDTDQQRAFLSLKAAINSAAVLKTPLPDLPFHVACDASQRGLGAALYQEEPLEGGIFRRRHIAFASKSLNGAQRNYPATKRELLGIVHALRAFSHWILGEHFILFTDHASLTTMLTSSHRSFVVDNWLDVLLEYDFEVRHRPGIQMVLSDALSRLFEEPHEAAGFDLSPSLQALAADEEAIKGIRSIRLRSAPPPAKPELAMAQFVKERLDKQSLSNPDDQVAMLRAAHAAGHFGAEALFAKVWKDGYFWSGMRKQCDDVVGTCHPCLQYSTKRGGFHPMLSLRADGPWDHVAMDCAVAMPESQLGNTAILILVDVSTRFVVARALPNTEKHTVARCLFEIFTLFGPPKVLQSDNGPEFINGIVKSLVKAAGVDYRQVAAYNPRANGLAERTVRTIKTALKKKLAGSLDRWDEALPGATFNINTKDHTLTKTAPFTLFFARGASPWADYSVNELALVRDPEVGRDWAELRQSEVQAILDAHKELDQSVRQPIQAGARERQDSANKTTDGRRKLIRSDEHIAPGALVYVIDQNKSSKWDPVHIGPFLVHRKSKRSLTYTLKNLSDGQVLPRSFPISQLLFIRDTNLPLVDQNGDPLPSGSSGNDSDIRRILRHRAAADGSTEYYVEWSHRNTANSWVPASAFSRAGDLTTYHRKGAHRPASRLQPKRAAKLAPAAAAAKTTPKKASAKAKGKSRKRSNRNR